MTPQRYNALMSNLKEELTQEEFDAGWHWCFSEWDGLLVGPTVPEWEYCTCYSPEKRKALEATTSPGVT
jgi:hypothetical protein